MNVCMFDNNASTCYDQIIPSMAMVKWQQAGTLCPTTNLVLKFLHNAQYHVQTAYEISTKAFSNFIDYMLGLIQGTGHARPGWALISSVMFDQMEPTHRAHFHSP